MRTYPFYVRPNLPEVLEPIRELAQNFWFSWNWQAVQLFIRMDPALWEESYQNPVLMLANMPQERIEDLARDDSFLANLNNVYTLYRQYLDQQTWFEREYPDADAGVMAYFSCEFGIAEGLQIYSGGLGILSGDHLKSSSDLGIPLVAVGLLYQEGYFRQYLNNDGWQQERYPKNDWYNMPVRIALGKDNAPIKIHLTMAGQAMAAQVWEAKVGRTSLYLLDTNIPDNSDAFRDITHRLYGGDRERRIQQEILLGIGGIRALHALGYTPRSYHMNEGHSAFLLIERMRFLTKERGLKLDEALEMIWASSVFTTHTPVPAGNERFATDLVQRYVKPFTDEVGLDWNRFLGLGRENPADHNEPFCMTVFALKLSSLNNGVAKLHGLVSRKMWQEIWPDLPLNEVPISSITNGIHPLTWISHDLRELLTSYLGPRLNERPWDLSVWENVDRIPDIEFWRMHQRRRERLVFFARKRLREQLIRRTGRGGESLEYASSVLNPSALTIGVARRFATYKRMTLLFSDPDRLYRLLSNPEQPVQIIFAGKAHPQDGPGKEMIKEIIHFSSSERFRQHILFIEDYDINVARYLVSGCDVWLNTPRRPLEASGTSGMKAAANGVLNLSVLDGWWDEAYTSERQTTGWSIGQGEEYEDLEYQDFVEGQALYDVLEREVIPLFYERDRSGAPREWIRWSKSCLKYLASEFNTHRMLMEYTQKMYLPAMEAHVKLSADGYARTKALAQWRQHVVAEWKSVHVESVQVDETSSDRLEAGETLRVDIRVRLGQLTPSDVRVQLYHGPMDHKERIVNGESEDAEHVAAQDGLHHYRAQVNCQVSGRRGYAARVIMDHPDLAHPFQSNMVVWE